MQHIDVKSNESLSKCHDFPKEHFACAIFILFINIGFYTIPGAGHLAAHSVPTPENLPTSLKKILMPGG